MCVQELKILRIAAIRAFGDNRRTKMDFGMCQHVLHVQTVLLKPTIASRSRSKIPRPSTNPIAFSIVSIIRGASCGVSVLPVVAVGNLHDQQSPTRERLRSKARGERTVNPKAIRVKSMRLNDQGIFLPVS